MRRVFNSLFGLALVTVIITSLGLNVSAQTAGQGLEINNPVRELNADPGQTIETAISLRNVTKEPLITKAEVNDFVAAGEDGQPKLLLEEGEESPYSIKGWVQPISSVELAPREQKTIPITFVVPQSASPGGHYGVIRFTGTPPGLEDTGVSLSASIGTLVLVNVSGDIKESATIEELATAQNGQTRSFFEYGPISLIERIKNNGNLHFKPSGTVRVTNTFNREVASFELNSNGGNVLPDSIRRFEQTLDKKFLFGRYTLQADVVYGSNNSIITETVHFWVIPYKLTLLIIAAIILLIVGIRRYNKYVIKRAEKKRK